MVDKMVMVARGLRFLQSTERYGFLEFYNCCNYNDTFQVAVPSLQSPKNAVAPSDIVFNRPPAANPISTGEFFTGLQSLHVKHNSSLHNELCNSSHFNCEMKLDRKSIENSMNDDKRKETATVIVNDHSNKELRLTDELSTSMGPSTSKIPQSLTTCLVDSMVRSCSVGKLGFVEIKCITEENMFKP